MNTPAQDYFQRADFARYVKFLTEWISLEGSTGLEIGPLDKPLVPRSRYEVCYVDTFPVDVLIEKCRPNPNRDETRVVPLDYVTGGRKLSEVVDRKFDYVVASHVLEHVPDFFGWLRDLAKILNEGGCLFAVVPDREFTFDRLRPLTSLGELMENDRRGLQKPSYTAAFDQRFYHVDVRAADVWACRGTERSPAQARTFDPRQAHEFGIRAESHYVDVHCSVFDPWSFQESVNVSHDLAIQPFRCTMLEPTCKPFLDFLALLRLPR